MRANDSITSHGAIQDRIPQPPTLPSLPRVIEYLQAQGYKVKKSAVYNHRAKGLIPLSPDGTFLVSAVDTYAAANLKRLDGAPSKSPGQLSEADKIALEAAGHRRRKEKGQADIIEIKAAALRGSLVPRGLLEKELIARLAIFRSDGENFFRGQAPAIVDIVSGDPAKIPQLIAFCLDAYEQHLSRYLQAEEFKVDRAAYEKIFEQADKADLDGADSADSADDPSPAEATAL
ncbi:MAG: hypothetical protein A4E65_02372 [Syntrophorhabdus sp. PtaU1.Bin153]|nr:MAG: hypothetical protein A4E65_02372 [Syntrophorhabdus sp. PtaU1.Bin153]